MENIIENTYYLTGLVMAVSLAFILVSYKISKRKKRPKRNVQISNMRKIMSREELREKFKYDLIGRWTSCNGTFIIVMNEVWIFYSNGKGITFRKSVIQGEDREVFLWRKKDLFCIEISYSEEDEPTKWIEIYYDFIRVPTDCGYITALVQLNEEGRPRKGFGLMEVPLSYESEA